MSTTAEFAALMVAKLQALLLENPGASEVSVDGTTIKYTELKDQLAYWERKAQRASGNLTIGTISIQDVE